LVRGGLKKNGLCLSPRGKSENEFEGWGQIGRWTASQYNGTKELHFTGQREKRNTNS